MHFCENGILVQSMRLLLKFFLLCYFWTILQKGTYKGNFETLRFFYTMINKYKKALYVSLAA